MKTLFKKGFTIVELVIVIAVIAILAGVLIPTFSGVVSRANQSAALTTARNTLDNALLMSSNASLPGKNADKVHYQTAFLVNGYAFGYNGNALESMDYPGYTSGNTYENVNTQFYHDTTLESNNIFNAVLLSASDLTDSETQKTYYSGDNAVTYYECTLNGNVVDIIKNATDLESVSVVKINGEYYINFNASGTKLSDATYAAKLYINSDFAKEIVVLTTFG